jgi:hypothetical protein
MSATELYRAVCPCGYKGRAFSDPNAADVHAENHARKFDPYQGGKSDSRRHRTQVEAVTQ